MNTEAIKSCPKCNAPIPAEAPQGLCPKCLLVAASIATESGQPAEGAAPPSLETIAAGFPHLEILEFIGQGGMGLVLKARQPKLDRLVALKLLPKRAGADPAFGERFNREARVLARLNHPNIVAVHDFGEAGPFFYLLMEYVDGVNLRQAMRAGRFTPAQALALVPKICDALQYAHEEGILHRDIKPENLLLDTRGRVKIADFGIAKLVGEARDITLTAKGAAIGTPHYMAPEQLERPQDVDQRADVYSLGVVFYEMLTGELPIGRFAPPSEKATMDPRVDQVVMRTLEKERERRFQSAGDVKTQVENITSNPAAPIGAAGQQPPLLQPLMEPGASRWSIRALVAVGLVGFSLLALALGIVSGARVGPGELPILFVLIGLPGVAGTVLAWILLRRLRAKAESGGKLALLSAVAWPLLLADLLIFVTLLISVKSFQTNVFHVLGGGLLEEIAMIGALAILGLDAYVLRKWLTRWNSERALPGATTLAFLGRLPRRTAWIAGSALVVLLLVGFIGLSRSAAISPPGVVLPIQEPNAPPGYEVAPGGAPGSDGRVYRSSLMIPAGYALTVSVVLCSNQAVLKLDMPNTSAVIMAPEGQLLPGQITWRLLGNTTLADGAPLQLSLGLPQGPQPLEKSLHIFTPEPVTVDWVGEPGQIWPPQNGHTRYLLVKGEANAMQGAPTEWAVGIEARLDPIPEDVLRNLKEPRIEFGSNHVAAMEANSKVPPETLAEYNLICLELQKLSRREKELLLTFTPFSSFVKDLREQIAHSQILKKRFEDENPGIAASPAAQMENLEPGTQ